MMLFATKFREQWCTYGFTPYSLEFYYLKCFIRNFYLPQLFLLEERNFFIRIVSILITEFFLSEFPEISNILLY